MAGSRKMYERLWPPLVIVCWPLANAGALPQPAVAAVVPASPAGPPAAMPVAARNTTALATAAAITNLDRDMARPPVLVEHHRPFGVRGRRTARR
ncbi:hypothetical protein GCM10017774_04850 [Lentzea cavernae]|uniref:Secreted protein n=1 Tax=Lentzea cavernae TaxID=2020703 RepID=A0ABQ3M4S5_9PSEU|nr:hypothetical protein GCM10017774_04850 [Lentzea cavernae]